MLFFNFNTMLPKYLLSYLLILSPTAEAVALSDLPVVVTTGPSVEVIMGFVGSFVVSV